MKKILAAIFIFSLVFPAAAQQQRQATQTAKNKKRVTTSSTNDQQLAYLPPMGWSSWYPFIDKINEKMIMETADSIVSKGLREKGYTILQLDDGWMAGQRDKDGKQYADPVRFPSGMKFLADYLHERGLKLGIYSSSGALTCAGYPGSYNHEEIDAKTYAEWGIDYLKYDACGEKGGNSDPVLFARMGNALKNTGRPIIYNICIFYSDTTHLWGRDLGNTWRTGGDIVKYIERSPEVTWKNWYENLQQVIGKEKFAGHGHWNDPDNLIVGYARNNKQTLAEQRAQFSFWSVVNAPLFLGNDVRNMPKEIYDIVTHDELIAINQDRAGIQGKAMERNNQYEIWMKPLSDGSRVLLLFNKTDGPLQVNVDLKHTGLAKKKLRIRDCWEGKDLGKFKKKISLQVESHEAKVLRTF